jgi:alpha-glucosidase
VTVQVNDWWRDAVIYQLYVRSFADASGDGIGDLDGIAERLDHIASLGVDGIWLNPCYPSPNHDGGYDVADYMVVDPRYGGMPAFEKLRDAAHARGLKLLMDLVPNHSSADHPWFRAALAAQPGSAERARFIFRDGRGPGGDEPPNNWRSVFGGPAWTRVRGPGGQPGQWYLHLFDGSQPDFDWDNPEVGDMFTDVLRAWFDRGIDGFRIDVAAAMAKRPGLPDLDDPGGPNPYTRNQPGVHQILRRWRAITDSYDRELTLVGEVWLPAAESVSYIRAGELHQAFNFNLMQQPFEAAAFRGVIAASLAAEAEVRPAGVTAWALSSHDVHRAVTRYGLVDPQAPVTTDIHAIRTRARGAVNLELGIARAKAAVLLMLALPGSAYLYQGEELGLPEVQDLPDAARQDPIWERSGHTEHGRDGCRVPLPWRAGEPAFGFSAPGATASPWLPQPGWFADFAIDKEDADPGSVLAFYRQALRARRDLDKRAPLEWVDAGRPDALAFRRGGTVCATVFGGPPLAPPADWGTEVITSGPPEGPATTWYRAG